MFAPPKNMIAARVKQLTRGANVFTRAANRLTPRRNMIALRVKSFTPRGNLFAPRVN
jgi:hypothetical protein